MATSPESSRPVVVGVTGHRVLADEPLVESGVEKALTVIRRRAGGRPIRVLSALAEGADRLVARSALAEGDELWALLPLARSDYLEDFEGARSRAEFAFLLDRATEVRELSPPRGRPDAYRAAGRWIVDQSDLLLAVWDGRRSQGHGGTADLVERARRHGLPVVRVHAGNRRQGGVVPTTLGDEQGRVSFLDGGDS